MLAQAHGYPGISPEGRSPVVLHPNASHGLASPYAAAPPRRQSAGLSAAFRPLDGSEISSPEGFHHGNPLSEPHFNIVVNVSAHGSGDAVRGTVR